MKSNNWKVTIKGCESRDFATKVMAITFAQLTESQLTESQGWSSRVIDIAGVGSWPGRVVWVSLDEVEPTTTNDKIETPVPTGIGELLGLGMHANPHKVAPTDWHTNGVEYGAWCVCDKCGHLGRSTLLYDYYAPKPGDRLKCESCAIHGTPQQP
jgi:hypothetical protein